MLLLKKDKGQSESDMAKEPINRIAPDLGQRGGWQRV